MCVCQKTKEKLSNEKVSNNNNNNNKRGNKERSAGLEKVCARCLLSCVPLPAPAPQPRAFSNVQASHSFDNSSKAPGFEGTSCFITKPRFLFLSRLLNPTQRSGVCRVSDDPACCVTLKLHCSRCLGPYIPLLSPEFTAEQSLVKLDTGKYISFLACLSRLF